MRDIRTADYQSIVNTMEGEGLSASSANKIKQLAGQLSKWAMREDIITTNYAQFIRIYFDTPGERRIFTDEEIQLLKSHDNLDTVKLILLLIYTGLRIGELFSLRLENIHLAEGFLVGGSKAKSGKNWTVPILPEALRAIIGHANYSTTVEFMRMRTRRNCKESCPRFPPWRTLIKRSKMRNTGVTYKLLTAD